MKRSFFTLASICILVLSTVAFAQDQQKDEATINSLNKKFAVAWNKGDGAAMGATYTEDGCLIDPFGTEARGRTAATALLTQTVSTTLKGSTTSFETNYIRFLKPDVAFVDATQTITGAKSPEGEPLPEMKFHLVLSIIKKDGQWWYVDTRPYRFMSPPEPVSEN